MRRLLVALCLFVGALPVLDGAPSAAAGPFSAGGSVNQVYATGLTPGATVDLRSSGGGLVASGVADPAGAHLFREVEAGGGYQVHSEGATEAGFVVTDPTDHPNDAWYSTRAASEPLAAGYGYLTTRDGTKLSVNVTFPIGAGDGPWPVVVNYSGYDPSQPGLPPGESLLYAVQGYVVVGVNMRGTGCSGGAFEFMETLQSTDGYDVVEALAHQPWSNGDVGMVGISYSGYSQLYVAATRPPHLRAITPLSPYSDTYSAILYPGGILNDGFAVEWATDRENGAKPRARGWVRDRIDGGDVTCQRNQDLRLQSKPLLQRIYDTPFAEHEFDYLNTETFVDQIQVPTYLASQWQDEQTGGSAANLMPLFDPATKVFASFTNGTHVEPMAPSDVVNAMAFVDIYVGKKVPSVSPLVAAVMPGELAKTFRAEAHEASFAIPEIPFGDQPTWAAAKAAWEAQPRVRLKWENGANPGEEGLPIGRAVTRHDAWPPPGLQAESLYLHPDGELWTFPTGIADGLARGASSYTYDPTTKRRKTFGTNRDAAWGPHPDYRWDPLSEGNALSFLTEPYAEAVAYAGQGSVDLWLRSSASDTDLEVTLTEVRPDGHEVYIQSGWLRASHRKLDDARSTELVPFHTHQAEDAAPLPAGVFTPVRIELFPFAHVLRPGSRLRVNVEAPGGNQPFWMFDALAGTATNEIAHSTGRPSRVVLPRLPEAQAPAVPASLPACTLAGVTTQAVSLRNQPCRQYRPDRIPTDVVATVADAEAGTVTVMWAPPPGPAPTGYEVVVLPATGPAPTPIEVDGGTTSLVVSIGVDVATEFRVVATYGDDEGPASAASMPVVVRHASTPTTNPEVGPSSSVPATQATTTTSTTVTTTVASPATPRPDDANRRYVRLLFRDVLGRTPDAAGERWWVALMDDGATRSDVAARFRRVPEVDERVVRTLYDTYLDRAPSADEVLLWTGFIGAGGRVEEVAGQLLGSPERWSATGGDAGRFVAGLFSAVLGRAPSATEAAAVGRQVEADGPTAAARGLLHSTESTGRRVDQLYAALLGRRPDAAGRAWWAERIASGGNLVDLLFSIAATPEYAARTPRSTGPDVLATAFG